MPDRLDIDPSRCWVRHVRRTDTGGTLVGAARFAAAALPGTNGPQGWSSATPERRLSDDGSMSITFPNATGEDGVPHVERFALLTDPAYRPGEEWLELYREPGGPGDLLFVGTPVEWNLTPAELTLTCADALALLANQRATEVDYWNGAAPREVFEHYTQAKRWTLGHDFTADPHLPDGWTLGAETGAVVPTPSPAGGLHFPAGNDVVVPATIPSQWELELRFRTASTGRIDLFVDGFRLNLYLNADGSASPVLQGPALALGAEYVTGDPVPEVAAGGHVTLRLITRGEFVFLFINGELTLTRRVAAAGITSEYVNLSTASGAALDLERLHVLSLEPFLMRGADRGAMELPGLPSPGGLRADYFNESVAHATYAPDVYYRSVALMPDLEPAASRLEPEVNHPYANPVAWQPAGVPANYFSARYTGAIYLDLAASDRQARVTVAGGAARLWIAGELVVDFTHWDGDPASPDATTGGLRAALGTSAAGWYPIRLEYVHAAGGGAIHLQDGPAGGTISPVPADRLSPLGTFTQAVRYDSHRELLGQITEAFGYQWRLEPRSLESGAFPGELVPRLRVGIDTDVIVDDLEGQEISSTGTAADAVDGLLADAGGLATTDPDAPGITGEFLLGEIAADHLVVHQAYESLAEISEQRLLEQRATSILALRAAPAETIAARPAGQRGLARILEANAAPGPLTFTGEFARMRWEPGDGVRLNLDGLRTRDLTPRQITAVAWPCRPDGVGPPTVAFRQRPRGMRAVLAKALRVALTTARALNR